MTYVDGKKIDKQTLEALGTQRKYHSTYYSSLLDKYKKKEIEIDYIISAMSILNSYDENILTDESLTFLEQQNILSKN